MTTNETAPNFYVSGPLDPEELAEVLRGALCLVREDHDRDVFTLLDALAVDRFTDMSRDACHQVARAVLKFLTGIAASETREPVLALHRWHRRNLDVVTSGTTSLEWAFAETVRQFDRDPLLRKPGTPNALGVATVWRAA